MREEQFHSWLQEKQGLQRNSADSYVGRAKSFENHFNLDLDTAAQRRMISDMIEKIKFRSDLGRKTKADYATALRRYDEFCGG